MKSSLAKIKRSLSFKLNVANAALVVLICIMVTVSYYNILNRRIESHALEEMDGVIAALSLALETHADQGDLLRVVGAMATKDTIDRMSIVSGNQVQSDSLRQFNGKPIDAAFDPVIADLIKNTRHATQGDLVKVGKGVIHQAHLLHLISPDVHRLRPFIVYIAYNSAPLEAEAMAELTEMIIIQVVAFLLILLINPLVQRQVVLKPIAAISEQLANNPRSPIKWRSDDEFGDFIDSYNQAIRARIQREFDLHQSRRYIDKVTNVIPVQLAYVDANAKIRFVNQRLLQWLCQKEPDVINQAIADVFPEDLEQFTRPYIKRVLKGRIQVFESEVLTPGSDRKSYLQSTYVPDMTEHGEIAGFFICVEDISAIKANEKKIEAYAQEMEFKNWALTDATEKAEQASRTKADFLACMSHEIRTPMNGVLGILSLLDNTQLSYQQRQYVSVASSSAEALLTLLNDILDFSKIESGKFNIEQTGFDVIQMLDEVIQPMALKAEEKGLQLMLDVMGVDYRWIKGDPTRLKQVLSNLVGNAIKFTEQGWVKVTLSVTDVDDHLALHASVQDTGIGIDESKQSMLFQPFVQADSSTTRHFGGTGLGLSIARRLCQLMGGDIKLQSEPGVGSIFSFHMTVQEDEPAVSRSWPCQFDECQIMLVDEQKDIEDVSRQLQRWGASISYGSPDTLELGPDKLPPNIIVSLSPASDALGEELARLQALAEQDVAVMAVISHQQLTGINGDLYQGVHLSSRPVLTPDLESFLTGSGQSGSRSSQAFKRFDESNKVLLVEDSKVNQMVISGMLRNMGLNKLVIAANGVKALQQLQQSDFDLILMDCQMPVMDGYQTTQAIRAGRGGHEKANLPIIALTANAMSGDREKCLDAGMDAYISKPVSMGALSDVISQYLAPVTAVAEVKTPEKEPTTELLDYDRALRTLMGDAALLNSALIAFVEEARSWQAQLDMAIQDADKELVDRLCHTVKGAAANLAMGPLSAKSREMELAAKADNWDQVSSLHPEFTLLCDATIEKIRSLLAANDWGESDTDVRLVH